MSTFLLSQNGKVGVYGNGDRVYGSGGTEKALIMTGATNVVVENTVEEIHVVNNMNQLTFSVDTNTNEVHLLSGTTTLAVFAPNAAGIKLFTATGMSVIKSVVDTATGDISFTADNGATGATAIALPTDATALPADAIDASQTSENAGGSVPDTPTEPIDAETARAGLADGTYKGGDYILQDRVANLAGAATAVIEGATNIIARDTIEHLTDDSSLARFVLTQVAKSITAEDSFENLALKDTSGLTINKMVVNAKVNATINTSETLPFTVAEVQGANEKLEALFNDTTVEYSNPKFKPASAPTLGTYYVDDTVAAIAAAPAKVLSDAATDGVTATGSMKDFYDNLAVISNANVDNLDVEDSLTNFLTDSSSILSNLKAANSVFMATDTPATGGVVTASISSKAFTDTTKNITFDPDVTVKQVNLEATEAIGTSSTFLLDSIFDETNATFTVNFTGTDAADKITAFAKGGTINGGGGKDEITLGDGNDTVVLGSDNWNPSDSKPADSVDQNNSVTIKTFAIAKDRIDFGGMFADFTQGKMSLTDNIADTMITIAKNTVNLITNSTTSAISSSTNGKITGLSQGEGAIIAMVNSTTTTIYYVEDVDGDNAINLGLGKDIVVELASITSDAAITSTDFA